MFVFKAYFSQDSAENSRSFIGPAVSNAMVPAATALAQTAAALSCARVSFTFRMAQSCTTPHGPKMDAQRRRRGLQAECDHRPPEPYKKYVTSSNLENSATAGSVHLAPATWLSATRPTSGGVGANMSTTVDQLIARKISQDTTLPSLEVCSETTSQVAACSSGVLIQLNAVVPRRRRRCR
jgi:hypothetical protein